MDLGLGGRTVALHAAPGALAGACRDRFAAEGAVLVDDPTGADVVVIVPPPSGDLDLDAGPDALDAAWEPLVDAVEQYKAALEPTGETRRWGRLVYVVPAGELDVITGMGALGLHKCVGWEWGPRAVTANAVLTDDGADPAEVAATAAFLASDRAGYLSGVTLRVG